MYALIIEFDVEGLSRDEYEAFCTDAVPAIARVPGVIGKLFLADAESSRCGGIYTFTDAACAQDYLGSELFRGGVATNPAITNLSIRGSELLDEPTRAVGDAVAAGVAA